MHVECDPLPKVQSLSIMLNGTRLPPGQVAGSRLVIALPPASVRAGLNKAKLVLSRGKVSVKALEIHVRHQLQP